MARPRAARAGLIVLAHNVQRLSAAGFDAMLEQASQNVEWDIVLLQEVAFAGEHWIKNAQGTTARHHFLVTSESCPSDCLIVVHRRHVPRIRYQTSCRCATMVVLASDRGLLLFVSVHLPHASQENVSLEKNLLEIGECLRRITYDHVILGGDLNISLVDILALQENQHFHLHHDHEMLACGDQLRTHGMGQDRADRVDALLHFLCASGLKAVAPVVFGTAEIGWTQCLRIFQNPPLYRAVDGFLCSLAFRAEALVVPELYV